MTRHSDRLPSAGWIYIETGIDTESIEGLKRTQYYLAENESEEMAFDEHMITFVEVLTLVDITENVKSRLARPKEDDILKAVYYFLGNNDFMY
ncbi:hypothetical protein [Salinisphaera sp. Q1T1-3]|uniref:DUF7716 domain-containing protein n=1 Tax=Salinisphaera sp. Q1T1-3 TaxID=2321229 RepID=UPI000E70E359|nr:hypothetical protein [Salinisphaera sp. Q1T1-3]RJS94874.1 hypothetical protein D3260_03695 [Salinisphaera sp. Q1T1-3]